MTLKRGIPSHDAFSDFFNGLGPGELGRVLAAFPGGWAARLAAECPDDVVAVDGKALRRSLADASERQPPHPARAFAAGARPVLVKAAVDGNSNEITAIPAFLELPAIRGRAVTADVMHAQRSTAEAVTDRGGECILA